MSAATTPTEACPAASAAIQTADRWTRAPGLLGDAGEGGRAAQTDTRQRTSFSRPIGNLGVEHHIEGKLGWEAVFLGRQAALEQIFKHKRPANHLSAVASTRAATMSGKGAKGLSGKGAKGTLGGKAIDKDKKKPISRSARAGLQFPVGRIHRLLKVRALRRPPACQ